MAKQPTASFLLPEDLLPAIKKPHRDFSTPGAQRLKKYFDPRFKSKLENFLPKGKKLLADNFMLGADGQLYHWHHTAQPLPKRFRRYAGVGHPFSIQAFHINGFISSYAVYNHAGQAAFEVDFVRHSLSCRGPGHLHPLVLGTIDHLFEEDSEGHRQEVVFEWVEWSSFLWPWSIMPLVYGKRFKQPISGPVITRNFFCDNSLIGVPPHVMLRMLTCGIETEPVKTSSDVVKTVPVESSATTGSPAKKHVHFGNSLTLEYIEPKSPSEQSDLSDSKRQKIDATSSESGKSGLSETSSGVAAASDKPEPAQQPVSSAFFAVSLPTVSRRKPHTPAQLAAAARVKEAVNRSRRACAMTKNDEMEAEAKSTCCTQ